jgi:hypothetical protein
MQDTPDEARGERVDIRTEIKHLLPGLFMVFFHKSAMNNLFLNNFPQFLTSFVVKGFDARTINYLPEPRKYMENYIYLCVLVGIIC